MDSLHFNLVVTGFSFKRKRYIKAERGGICAYIEYRIFAGPKQAAITALADQGHVLVTKTDKEAFLDRVQAVADFPEHLVATHSGFWEPHFVMPNCDVISPDGIDPLEVIFKPSRNPCRKIGSRYRWRNRMAYLLADHPIAAFAVMATFAAPILPLTQRADGFSFEFVGVPGAGKSTALLYAASAWGAILEQGAGNYWTTFDTTLGGIGSMIEAYSGCPIIVDETNLVAGGAGEKAQAKIMMDFAFKVASGRGRSVQNHVADEVHRTIAMISSNRSLASLNIGGVRDVVNAGTDRLIPIPIDASRPYGIFEYLPKGFNGTGEFAKSILAVAAANHGGAARQFVQKLVDRNHAKGKALREQIADHLRRFRRMVGVSDNDGSACRVADAFGIVMVAGRLAKQFKVLPDNYDCDAIAVYCYRVSQPSWKASSAAQRIRALLADPKTVHLVPGKLPVMTNAELDRSTAFLYRPQGRCPQILIWPSAFKRMFSDWTAMLRDREVASMLRPSKTRPTNQRPLRANEPKDWVYCFEFPRDSL